MDLATAFALGVFAASNETIRPVALAIVPMIGFIWYEARRTAEEFCKVRPKGPPPPIKTFRRPVASAQPVDVPANTEEPPETPLETQIEKTIETIFKDSQEKIPSVIRNELEESKKHNSHVDRWLDEGKTEA